MSIEDFRLQIERFLPDAMLDAASESSLQKIIALVKDRCVLLTDFYDQSYFFFKSPEQYDLNAVKPKWTGGKKRFFELFIEEISATDPWGSAFIEDGFKKLAMMQDIKAGELQLPFRIMLVGEKFGPPVFEIAAILGKQETIHRIQKALVAFD